jgi:FAS-associated factor 2
VDDIGYNNMTEGDMDLGQLSTTQQEALDQYTQVTNQEISEAIPLLRRSEWNVQVSNPLLCSFSSF